MVDATVFSLKEKVPLLVLKEPLLLLLAFIVWALVEATFLFGGSMDKGLERRKGHWVVITQQRGNVEATRRHGGLRKRERDKEFNSKGYQMLTKLCTTRHCGIAHTATTKGCPPNTPHPSPVLFSFSSPPGRSLGPRPTPSRERAGHRRDAFMGLDQQSAAYS